MPTVNMELLVALALWVALAAVVLLAPLVGNEVTPMTETRSMLEWGPTGREDDGPNAETTASTPDGRPMTDGGRRCHNCGAHVDGDYLYCGQCLMPKV
jgi:hypothetical protein